MDVTTLEKLKKEAAEALSAALGNSTQWRNVETLVRTLATLDGMELDDDDYVPQLSREEAVKAMADLSGINSVVRGTPPDPRCTLCGLGAPPHTTHGLSAKFEAHGMANVPSGQAMLLDGPAPTPKQDEYIRRETLEVAAQCLENLKLIGAHECAEVVRLLKPKESK